MDYRLQRSYNDKDDTRRTPDRALALKTTMSEPEATTKKIRVSVRARSEAPMVSLFFDNKYIDVFFFGSLIY